MNETGKNPPLAVPAEQIAPRSGSAYPDPFRQRVAGREKRALGEAFGLANFGVNLARLPPGVHSSLMHRHHRQDEFIFILQGEPTLRTDRGETKLRPGMCAGFPAGGVAHHLVNDTETDVIYVEIGDRTAGDRVDYPHDDLEAAGSAAGGWEFFRKDGTPYAR